MPMDFQLKSICDHQHKEIEELEQQLKQTQDRLKDAEGALSKYADVNNWSYQQIIDDISEVNGSLEGGAEAREYFKKYGESDLEFKGACYACEVVAETNIKLQKALDIAMEAINNTMVKFEDYEVKYYLQDYKQKIQEILKGKNDE